MMPSTLSSQKPEPESTSQDASSSILNQLSSTKSELEPTDNSSTPNNLSQEKKMLQTTLPEDTTPSERKSLTFASTESESLLTTALVSKDSLCSTQLEEELDQDSDHSFLKDFQSIMERNQNSASPSILHPKSQPLLLNPTTQFFQLTPFLSTLMSLSCSTMKQFTIFAEEISILKDPPTPT